MKLSYATIFTMLATIVVAIPASETNDITASQVSNTNSFQCLSYYHILQDVTNAGGIRLCPYIVRDTCSYEAIDSGKCVTVKPALQNDLGTINISSGYICFFYKYVFIAVFGLLEYRRPMNYLNRQAGCGGDSSIAYNPGLTVFPDPRATRSSYRCVAVA